MATIVAARKKWFSSRLLFSIIAFIIVAGITIWSGLYTKSVMNPSELVHFFVPFPAGKVVKPVTLSSPTGAKIFTKPITINVDERGILKRLLNPGIEGISTHWLTNIDTQPHRIGLKLTETGVPIRWEVGAGIPWDEEKRVFAEALAPGESVPDLGIDWFFEFPKEVQAQQVWYKGGLTVFDADTGAELTFIPITIQAGGQSR